MAIEARAKGVHKLDVALKRVIVDDDGAPVALSDRGIGAAVPRRDGIESALKNL
jgi:hypothetical protein